MIDGSKSYIGPLPEIVSVFVEASKPQLTFSPHFPFAAAALAVSVRGNSGLIVSVLFSEIELICKAAATGRKSIIIDHPLKNNQHTHLKSHGFRYRI